MNLVVLSGYGLNCEEETLFAFMEAGRHLNAKVSGQIMHINELLLAPKRLREFNTMVIPGGFSYGDDTGAGNAFALRMLHGLEDEMQAFVEHDKLLLGICNGCQILLRVFFPDVALVRNDVGRYQCRWVKVKSCGHSVWLEGIDEMYIPVAHGEGKFYAVDGVLPGLVERGNVAMRYTRPDGEFADGQFPHNPNGSVYDIAALSGNSGRALLMMPHPERAVFFTQRYDWTDIKDAKLRVGAPIPTYADGFEIFCNAVRYFA
ncbi:phosphoribosylformylglycinamidine synthase subunit PurQ [Anaplasma capra]|uniref:phosphoribosylformylglycinamidine synthase subunit PurQ n=1 Tax=Anaplasma capra TaxID=1562740 RepID=UPI0021D60A8F|nr:phosphoribosylformylglycinamidine synthase subunit PurQ [Anaplasma capra]MCU7611827.1 phosphoribosylformylglycinamidine synthase subunit PurQ [Anaplasma capra]MCU7612579.1 phosphoribosylformylglycinamidine synthase subunit PurQ [Anaplasma capra]